MSNIHIPKGPTIRLYFDPHTLHNGSWYTYLENAPWPTKFIAFKVVIFFFVVEFVFSQGPTKEWKAESARLDTLRTQWDQEMRDGTFKKVGEV